VTTDFCSNLWEPILWANGLQSTPVSGADNLPGPYHHFPDAWCCQVVGFVKTDPAIFIVLGSAELRRYTHLDLALAGSRQVIPRYFALAVGSGFDTPIAPVELQLDDPGLFFDFALRCLERLLTRFANTLGEIPVVIRPQQQGQPLVSLLPGNDDSAG